jgi:hypothetical protein
MFVLTLRVEGFRVKSQGYKGLALAVGMGLGKGWDEGEVVRVKGEDEGMDYTL